MRDPVAASAMVQDLAAQAAVVEAILLAATGLHKAANWQRSRKVVQGFARVPRALAAPALGFALTLEGMAAWLLCVPGSRAAGGFLAALLWSAYLCLIVRAVADGRRDVDCGCSFGETAARLGFYQILRNTGLAATAAAIGAVSLAWGAVSLVGEQLLGGVGLALLYVALDQIMATPPLRTGRTA